MSSTTSLRVVVTGASGMLGSQVYNAFKQDDGCTVLGLAHSRTKDGLRNLDLTDESSTEETLTVFKPDWVIHCAAERRPDIAEKDPDAARVINVSVPGNLAKLSKALKFKLVYISTDYVFDGTSPPYTPSSPTNPLNLYGQTKRDGEIAVLSMTGSQSIVLRVPVLYGPVEKNSDSAINVLLDYVADTSGKRYKMDHYATRYPTNVVDIADFLLRLTKLPPSRVIPPILHYSAGEPFTKYEICLVLARIRGLSHEHIIADAEPPKEGTPRPRDCQLYTRETEELMEGYGGLSWTPFEEAVNSGMF
ncbi:NAD-P-binding protein [Trametes gibbosa]|nr:NAD-P-binding protein [Trametes gibbosa]